MFGSSLFGGFGSGFNDPFFEDMQETHRRHMNSMRSMFPDPFMSPMSMTMFPNQVQAGALEAPGGADARLRVQQRRSRDPFAMSPFGMMNSMFADMDAMMGNMHRNVERLAHEPSAHSYSTSTVMSYSSNGSGQPEVYQASTTSRQAPGGVRETRNTVRDSKRGIEKMSIGHHIGERSHVIEKSKNTRTGDMEEKQDFINLDDTDAQRFDQEWRQRTGAGAGRSVGAGRSRPARSAITDGREYMHDREHRPTRPRDYEAPSHSVHFDRSDRSDRSERSSDDAAPYQRRPTPARPKGPSKGGRQRNYHDD